ncbi:MAG: hypothetical protein AAF487_03245 [Bacteroidota bacterium]
MFNFVVRRNDMKKTFSALAILVFLMGTLSSCSKNKSCAAYSKADVEQAKEINS